MYREDRCSEDEAPVQPSFLATEKPEGLQKKSGVNNMKRGFEIHMGLGGYKDRTVWGDV